MADNNQDFIQVLLEKIEKDDLPTNVFDVEGTDPLVLLGKMNEIIGQLENFQSSVNTSNSTANEALSKAEDAVDTSGQALSNANTALGTANQAIGTANTAIETANQSLETAQNAENIAGQALSNSNTALNTANTAIDTANTALGTANTALSTSQSANATSSQALDTANNANATANSALESAGTANTTAETAKNIAETANQNSNQAVTTANEAKGIADTANQNSGQAVTTANEAKSTAENALEQVTQGLGTKVYDNSGNLLNETTFEGSNGINVDMDDTSHKNFVISIDQQINDKISQNETDISELQSVNNALERLIVNIVNNTTKIKTSNGGFSAGNNASASFGGAIGNNASASFGGAVGCGAKVGKGFAGGYNAKAQDTEGNYIDAIQLGTGTNVTERTLKIYNDNIYNASTHTLTVQNATVGGNEVVTIREDGEVEHGTSNQNGYYHYWYKIYSDGTIVVHGVYYTNTDAEITIPFNKFSFRSIDYFKCAFGSFDNAAYTNGAFAKSFQTTYITFASRGAAQWYTFYLYEQGL